MLKEKKYKLDTSPSFYEGRISALIQESTKSKKPVVLIVINSEIMSKVDLQKYLLATVCNPKTISILVIL